MIRRAFLALTICALTGPALAQSVKLTQAQIAELLTGNTAIGIWQGAPYRQFFDLDGRTIYAQDGAQDDAQYGARSSVGQWRVQDDEYQSIWPGDPDWQGWFVMEFAGDYYWVSRETPPTAFQVVKGQQLGAD